MVVHTRRAFVGSLVAGAAAFSTPGLFAQTLTQTTRTGEGPFYPDKMPLDTDNDLLIVNNSITPAVGEITHLGGRLLSRSGEPIRNAFIEIWQVDNKASYIHTDGANTGGRDGNFQGYGRFLTDRAANTISARSSRFLTPCRTTRTAHIHYAISKNGRRIFTTQMHIKDHPDNSRDFILNGMRDAKMRETVLAEFRKIQGSKIGELSANFDIVMGYTAANSKTDHCRAASANQKVFARENGCRLACTLVRLFDPGDQFAVNFTRLQHVDLVLAHSARRQRDQS